jgi:hypothetical protein
MLGYYTYQVILRSVDVYLTFLQYLVFILIVKLRNFAATGTRHGQCNLSANGFMGYPGSIAAGSFIVE